MRIRRTYSNASAVLSAALLLVIVASTNAVWQPAAEAVVWLSSAQGNQDVRAIEPNKPIERELVGGQDHLYLVALRAGQYLHVVVDQRGIDVVVRLSAPDERQESEVNLTSAGGLETLSYEAPVGGDYRLTVRALDVATLSGSYQVRLEVRAAATEQDKQRIAAERLLAEANQLSRRGAAVAEQTLAKADQALLNWREIGDQYWAAYALNLQGQASRSLNRHEKSIEYYKQALAIRQEVKDRAGEGGTLNNLGTAYQSLSRYEKAIEYYEQALAISREVKDRAGEGIKLNNLGTAYRSLSRYEKAIEYFEQALAIRRVVKDRVGEGSTLNNLGTAYQSLSRNEKAIEYFEQALAIRREVRDQDGEGRTLNNLGIAYRSLSLYEKAIEYYEHALAINREMKNRVAEGITLGNLGNAYRSLSRYEEAIEYYEHALAISREVKDRASEGRTLSNLGIANHSLSRYKKAIEYFDQALAIRREVKDRAGEGITLGSIGNAYRSLGQYERAIEYYEQAQVIQREVKDRDNEGHTLNNLGNASRSLSRYEKAIEYYEQALVVRREVRGLAGEATTLFDFAEVERERGNYQKAKALAEDGLKIAESLRSEFYNRELRSSYFASVQDYYTFYTDLLMHLHQAKPSQGFDALAVQANENARARILLEQLSEARADIRQGVDPALLERERTLQQRINANALAQTQLLNGGHTETQAAAIAREIEELTTQYQQVEAQIRATSPRYAALTQPQALALSEIQQLLDSDTLLLEYSLGKERSYLWAITPTSITSYELPKRDDIEKDAGRVHKLFTVSDQRINKRSAELAAADLSRMVLEPVAAQLGGKRLLIVADGALQYVPFGALPKPATSSANRKPLIADHEVVHLPSASTLAMLRRELAGRQSASKTVAVLADPVFLPEDVRVRQATAKAGKEVSNSAAASDGARGVTDHLVRSAKETGVINWERLPFTRQEAEAITQLAQQQSLKALDFEASRATATNPELSQYRIVHFATHGLLNSQHPELSGIVLSLVDERGQLQDGFLRLHDIYNLKLNADLVVLSACQTALGKDVKGEGLVGLTRGFMHAGAPRVVASLWSVKDEATAELMKRFYRGMLKENLPAAAALRAAQLSMWREKRWEAPYYWAGFALQGEWK